MLETTKRFLAMSLVMFLAPVPTAFGADRRVAVPFDLYGNNILVPVRVNGSESGDFIFDTGAAVNVADAGWVKRLGLEPKGGQTLGALGGNVEAQFIEGIAIGLPGLASTNQSLAVVKLDAMPPLFGRNVRGILGNTFIQNYVVEFDYAGRTLVFHPPGSFNLAADPKAQRLEIRGGIPFLPVEVWLSKTESFTGSFEIDSGSNGALAINRPFAEERQIRAKLPANRVAEGVGGAGVGGDTTTLDARIHKLRIGGHVLSKPIVNLSQDASGVGASHEAGLIGGEILRRFTVVLDLASRRVLLKPNARFRDPFESDLSGIELMAEPDDFQVVRIKAVRPGFPALAAGLKPGDRLLTVDSRPAGQIGLDGLVGMFRQNGKSYDLQVQRDAREFRIRLKLKRVI